MTIRHITGVFSVSVLTFLTIEAKADRTHLDPTKTQIALPLATPPTIDGTIETAEWERAGGGSGGWKVYIAPDADGNPTIRGGFLGDSGTPPKDDLDLSYNIYAGYDADNLYIAVRVKDDSINTDSAEAESENGSTWNDDSVEVFIDGDNSNFATRDTSGSNPDVVGSGGQFVITANNAYRDAEAGNPVYGPTAAWYAKTAPLADGTGYEAEFRISLKAIGNPKPGDIIGFTVAVNDDDNGDTLERQLIWVGKPHTEVSFGNLILGRPTYTAPKVASAPLVDGIVHAEEYAGAQEIRLDGSSGLWELDGLSDGFPASDLSYRAWAVHSGDSVFVAVEVRDNTIVTDSAEAASQDGNTWEDDSVEVFFDADHSRDLGRGAQNYEGQYVITANGATRDNEANNPTFGEANDWYAVQKPTFDGYSVEFQIKKAALLNPADGSIMGFNISVNDDDGANRKGQLSWPGRAHHEFTYGDFKLGPAATPTTPPGRQHLDDTKTQFALPLTTPPTIDGTINTAEWERAGGGSGGWKVYIAPDADGNPSIRGGFLGDSGTPPKDDLDLSYNIYAGYDADNLYIAVRVKDDSINTDSAEAESENGSTWNDDSVEVFIDGDNSNFATRDTSGSNPDVVGSGGQFVITANNAYRDAEAGNPVYGPTAAWYAKTAPLSDGTGYEAEFRISLKSIGNPKPGDIIGFTVAVNDDDNGEGLERQLIWVGKPHTEVSFGNLVLGSRSYTAPKATTAPLVDGIVHAAEYAGAEELRINGTSGSYELDGLSDNFPADDHSFRAWAVHSGDSVFVAVEVRDNTIVTDSAEAASQDGNTWEDDSVEIFFDADRSLDLGRGSQNYEGQYVITANGAIRDNEANNPTFGEANDWYAVQKPTFDGYSVEFQIKKSALLNPADGSLMGFNIAINDDDGANRKAQLNWSGRPHHEFTFGTLKLAGSGGGGGGSVHIDGIQAEASNLKLTFTASNATATFKVQEASNLAQPQWSDVAGVNYGTAGAARTATFAKPAASPRFYRVSMQ